MVKIIDIIKSVVKSFLILTVKNKISFPKKNPIER
jgi:hypothetical protein